MGERKKKFEERKRFEVDLRIRVFLTLISCRKVETLNRKSILFTREDTTYI